jgi:hypothetical protein
MGLSILAKIDCDMFPGSIEEVITVSKADP